MEIAARKWRQYHKQGFLSSRPVVEKHNNLRRWDIDGVMVVQREEEGIFGRYVVVDSYLETCRARYSRKHCGGQADDKAV